MSFILAQLVLQRKLLSRQATLNMQPLFSNVSLVHAPFCPSHATPYHFYIVHAAFRPS